MGGDRVRVRDNGYQWLFGLVTESNPILKVEPNGWNVAYTWDQVEQVELIQDALFKRGDRVRVRDNGNQWLFGLVTESNPILKVKPNGWNVAYTWDQVEQDWM